MMPSRRKFPHLGWLLLSLAITAAVAGPGTAYLKPRLIRWNHLRNLTSPNLAARERALNFVIRHARDDRDLLRGAISSLEVRDGQNFAQIVNALEFAGRWRRPGIPNAPWLRWVGLLAMDKDPQARILAAQRLGEPPDLGTDPTAIELVSALTNDPADDVRFNALISAAAMLGFELERPELPRLIWRCTEDTNPAIAREAWIILGLRQPRRGFDPAIATLRPTVGEAAVWAAGRTSTGDLRPVIDTLEDDETDGASRAMAVYILSMRPDEPARNALKSWHARRPPALTSESQALLWRTILTAPLEPEGARPDTVDRLLLEISLAPQGAPLPPASRPATAPAVPSQTELLLPLLAAGQFRHGLTSEAGLTRMLETDPLLAAAALAGTPRDRLTLRVPDRYPDVLRLLAISATRDPRPEDLYKLLTSEVPAIRDHACVIAADRFTPEQNSALIREGFKDFDDKGKISAAMLAGLTGLETELLRKKMIDEDIWAVQQMMRLGLWMQGRLPEVESSLVGLLSRPDMPRTTVLLAMLHARHPKALDYLLNPRGEPWPGLAELLTYQAWWPVLKRYLPEDAPPLWPWADRALVQFQIDTLRDWRVMTANDKGPPRLLGG